MPRHSLSRAHFLALTLTTLGSSILASANEFVRPLDPQDYFDGPPGSALIEHAQRVQGVRVAWVNFEALRRDFPAIATLDEQQIRDWLIQHFAYVGSEQYRLNGLRNSPIPTVAGDTRIAIRPEGWRRSAAMEAIAPDGSPIGMVDVKGVGHGARSNVDNTFDVQIRSFQRHAEQPEELDRLRIADHSDGLMSLGEAIAEVTREQATQLLLNESGLSLETVESYAILALPFDILKDHGQRIPAALYLRQANLGRFSGLGVPSSILTDRHGGRQYTRMRTMVDFGGVVLQDPRIEAQFGPSSQTNAQATRPWIWGHETAIAFAKDGDHEAVNRHMREMLAPLKSDASIRAAQERHRLFERRLFSILHQNRHLTYEERVNGFARARQQSTQINETAHAVIDRARAVLSQEPTPYLSAEGQQAIQSMMFQGSIQVFEFFKEVFFRSHHSNRATVLARLSDYSGSPFFTESSQELFVFLRDVYLNRSDLASDSYVRVQLIGVLLKLREHTQNSNQVTLLSQIEQILESVSDPRELETIIQALKGQSNPLATQILLRALQSPTYVRDKALRLAPYNNDPQVVRWIEQNFEGFETLPNELVNALNEARNPQYLALFQRRLQHLFTLPTTRISRIVDTLSMLSVFSVSSGIDSSQALVEAMPRLDPVELFLALVNFRGNPTLELINAVRAQAHNPTTSMQQRAAIHYVLERGLSHLLRQQNHPESLELIQELMRSADKVTVTQALRALGNYSDLRSAEMLDPRLNNGYEPLALAAAQALFDRTDSHAVRIRELALNHEGHWIRARFARAQTAHYLQHLPSRCNRLLAD